MQTNVQQRGGSRRCGADVACQISLVSQPPENDRVCNGSLCSAALVQQHGLACMCCHTRSFAAPLCEHREASGMLGDSGALLDLPVGSSLASQKPGLDVASVPGFTIRAQARERTTIKVGT
eukprot:5209657-Amphidinium_carterae.1